VLPPGCDTYRGERGGPRHIETSEEWWGQIDQAFSEKALEMATAGKPEFADALMDEIYHAKQVAACESLGDVFQMTRYSTPSGVHTWDGLFQHSSQHWSHRLSSYGLTGSIFDPLTNSRLTAEMVAEDIAAGRDPWIDWACDDFLKSQDPPLWD
jgi:hypothetical protein